MEEPRFYEHIRVVVNVMQVASWLKYELEAALSREVGLTHAEYEVLMQLLQHGSRVPIGELAGLVLFSQSGGTRVVDRLERKGLARRESSTEDRRITYVVLTDRGYATLDVAMPLVRGIMAERFNRHLSDEDEATMRRILLGVIRGNGWLDERQVSHQPPPRLASAGSQADQRGERSPSSLAFPSAAENRLAGPGTLDDRG